MKTYELSYIISPETTSEEAESKGKEFELAIQTKEGIILKQINPTAKTLAFPIAKRASGFFGVMEFQLEPEKLLELKDIVEKDKKIVRYIIVIKDRAKPKRERGTRKPDKSPEGHFDPLRQSSSEASGPATMPAKQALGGEEKPKVELKDIEQQLDELLG
jgi:ribosomal protein S6